MISFSSPSYGAQTKAQQYWLYHVCLFVFFRLSVCRTIGTIIQRVDWFSWNLSCRSLYSRARSLLIFYTCTMGLWYKQNKLVFFNSKLLLFKKSFNVVSNAEQSQNKGFVLCKYEFLIINICTWLSEFNAYIFIKS